jgi:ABC-type uncharacterized transport system permease subunit
MPWGIFVGVVVSALLVVAQGLGSGRNQVDWCGSAVVFFFVAVGITALIARLRSDPSQDDQAREDGR